MKLNKDAFIEIIEDLGFVSIKSDKWGAKIFETNFKSDGWVDGYKYKYIISIESVFGLLFYIDKFCFGGFCGNEELNQRLFFGSVDTKEEFDVILKCIGFEKE